MHFHSFYITNSFHALPHLTTWLYCAPLRGLWGQGGLMSQGLHDNDSPYYCPPKHSHFRAPLASYINTIYHMEWLIEHLHCVVLTAFFGKYFVLVLLFWYGSQMSVTCLSLLWPHGMGDLKSEMHTPHSQELGHSYHIKKNINVIYAYIM